MARSFFLWLVMISVAQTPLATQAGTYNEQLDIGAVAPAWVNLPGVDGKMHSLADLKDKEVVVVVFTCCSCPASVDYEDRIIAFAKKHAGPKGKVGLVAINVNTIPEDRLPKMKERAQEKEFPFPFLYDETQKIARFYGAAYTPEFFVLNKERKIVYMGAMDDRDNPAQAKINFLEDAVAATLKGEQPVVKETLGRGCRIRFARKKN